MTILRNTLTATVTALAMALPAHAGAETTALGAVEAQVAKQHDAGIRRLQEWIRLPSIAAEDRGFPEGPDYVVALLREVGFQSATVVPTDGKPGVFATLDAGADKTVGVYMMYDVKQFVADEWSSPPLDAALVEKPGLGTAVVGRGAVMSYVQYLYALAR